MITTHKYEYLSDNGAFLSIESGFANIVADPNAATAKLVRQFLAEIDPSPQPPTPSESFTFDDPRVGAILAKRQIFPKHWTCYQPVDQWPLHPNDAAMRGYLQYDPGVKLLQEFAPVFNVLTDGEKPWSLANVNCGPSPSGMPDEAYTAEFLANEYLGFRPIPTNLCVKIDEAYFEIPESGPWKYIGVPDQEILEQYQRGEIGTNMDRHAIVVDEKYLYEFYKIFKYDKLWYCGYAVVWDLSKLPEDQRDPSVNAVYGNNSCDAAGLPIFPLIIRRDELESGEINHAIRVTIQPDMIARKWVSPACHQAGGSDDPRAPRYGERLRLRADVDISKMSPHGQTIARALKKYGAIVADGGLSIRMSCAPNVAPLFPVMHGDFHELNFEHLEFVVPSIAERLIKACPAQG